MTKVELRQRLSDLIHQRGYVDLIGGALGELEGCNAYAEETIKEGMWRTKYLGISCWFKGITDNDIIDRVTITKRAFREIIMLWPLNIRRVINSFVGIYEIEGGLKSRCLKQKEFCTACQELIRLGMKVAGNESRVVDLVYCFAMFLQFSPTYRLKVQDIFGELDKGNFQKRPLTEILRLKKIFLTREYDNKPKMEWMWRLAFMFVMFNRKIVRQFVADLDIEKIKLDSDDWYFCLRRSSYDFRGKSLYSRLVEAEIIDRERGNLVLGI